MTLKEYIEKNNPDLLNLEVNPETGLDDVDEALFLLPLNVWNWTHIIIHHSLTEDSNVNDWESIRKYHKEVNGWKDIGYAFGIEYFAGKLVLQKGRPLTMEGAHTLGFNDKGIGISVVGNFDKQPPNKSQLEKLTKLTHGLMLTYKIKVENVLGHRETYALRGVAVEKTCPGSQFDMDSFRRGLEI